MNFETELASVLRQYDMIAARSLRNLTDMLAAHGWTREEMEGELEFHRAEIEAERLRVAEEFARQMGDWFERDGDSDVIERLN